MLAGTAEQHIRAAVQQGAFSATPFPHLFVTDLLPGAFYRDVEAAWPAFDEMSKPNPTIGRLDFTDPHLGRWVGLETTSLTGQQHQTWATFRSLIGQTFFEEAFSRFKPHMLSLGRELLDPAVDTWGDKVRRFLKRTDLSFWRNAAADDFVPRDQFLTTRKDLSALAPHIDPPYFHFTLIVYFATDADHQHLGTTLFRQTSPGRAKLPSETEGYTQYASQYEITCEQDCSLPLLPNSALLFINGLHSWHGQHLDESFERRTYNSFFMVRPDRIAMALRPQDLESMRQRQAI
jgi:hypothetical protein